MWLLQQKKKKNEWGKNLFGTFAQGLYNIALVPMVSEEKGNEMSHLAYSAGALEGHHHKPIYEMSNKTNSGMKNLN